MRAEDLDLTFTFDRLMDKMYIYDVLQVVVKLSIIEDEDIAFGFIPILGG